MTLRPSRLRSTSDRPVPSAEQLDEAASRRLAEAECGCKPHNIAGRRVAWVSSQEIANLMARRPKPLKNHWHGIHTI